MREALRVRKVPLSKEIGVILPEKVTMPLIPYSPERTIRFIFGYYFVTESEFFEYVSRVRAMPGNKDLEYWEKARYLVRGTWVYSYESNLKLFRPILK